MHVIDKCFLYYKIDSCLNYLRLMLSSSNTLSLKTLIKVLENKKRTTINVMYKPHSW